MKRLAKKLTRLQTKKSPFFSELETFLLFMLLIISLPNPKYLKQSYTPRRLE